MKKRTEKWMSWTLMVVLASQVVGVVFWIVARPGDKDLFTNGTLSMETALKAGVSLPHAHATLEGSSLRIYGRLRQESSDRTDESGKLNVSLLTQEGQVLGTTMAEYRCSPRLPKGGGDFSVTLPFHPPEGRTVRIERAEVPR